MVGKITNGDCHRSRGTACRAHLDIGVMLKRARHAVPLRCAPRSSFEQVSYQQRYVIFIAITSLPLHRREEKNDLPTH